MFIQNHSRKMKERALGYIENKSVFKNDSLFIYFKCVV